LIDFVIISLLVAYSFTVHSSAWAECLCGRGRCWVLQVQRVWDSVSRHKTTQPVPSRRSTSRTFCRTEPQSPTADFSLATGFSRH